MKLTQELITAIEESWGDDTSVVEFWTRDNRAQYQAQITTAFLWWYLDCTTKPMIMLGEIAGRRHYWLSIDGHDVDLTRRQFSVGVIILDPCEILYSQLIDNSWLHSRLMNLIAKVGKRIKLDADKHQEAMALKL